MKFSKLYIPTLKETPAEAELISHKLMLRSGMIRKLASGLYTWLPLGLKVLQKVEAIIRQEMLAVNALEVLMPAIQPAELWLESNRWQQFGPQLLKLTDRHQREYCFGPTHEEVITDLIRNDLKSYKSLPVTFFQIQTKFRDEIRPRFGVMRSREFLMKDAYSFDINLDNMQQSYDQMFTAYTKIFSTIGLKFRAVAADSGAIGGNVSQEFHALADSGEDELVYSDASDYAANIETATALPPTLKRNSPNLTLKKVATPNITSVVDQAAHLGIATNQIIKTIIVASADQQYPAIALLIRGDDQLNIIKAAKHPLVQEPCTLVNTTELASITNCKPGFCGPINLDIPIIADPLTLNMADFSCGANENDWHYTGVNWQRDLTIPEPDMIMDLRLVKEQDLSPDNKGKLKITRGIEVGHIFQLGNKYSQALNASVLDSNGKAVYPYMGCYGIGVSRIVAAAIEQNNDANGIIWPKAITPFDIIIIPINYHKDSQLQEYADNIYATLLNWNIDALLDDRKERAGIMFKEAELIGIPHRIVINSNSISTGKLEYKSRTNDATLSLTIDELKNLIL